MFPHLTEKHATFCGMERREREPEGTAIVIHTLPANEYFVGGGGGIDVWM